MNEQQHLEEVIGRFLQNTREYEEISKGIVNCEQSIFENFVMTHMYVGEE